MAITKEKKEKLVQTYVELLENSQALVLVYAQGLTVSEVTQLRVKVREAGSSVHVIKNTLFKRALSSVDMPTPATLTGPVMVVFCQDDIAAVVKTISDYGRVLGEREYGIVGGIIDKQALDADHAKALATMPSRNELFAQILAGINAPASQVTGVVAGGIRQILNVLQARIDQLQENSESA